MYHLRLIKALSYSGIVEATKQKPDVFVEDKAIADKAIATGYFQLENSRTTLPNNGENADGAIPDGIMLGGEENADGTIPNGIMPDGEENADDTIPDGVMPDGEEGTDDPVPDGIISGNGEDSTPADETPKGKTLDEMSRAELETFATYKNVAVKGLSKKADIVAKLREVLGPEETSGIIEYGSPTMTELQQQ